MTSPCDAVFKDQPVVDPLICCLVVHMRLGTSRIIPVKESEQPPTWLLKQAHSKLKD